MSFQDLQLNPLLIRNLNEMGYRHPRPIQAQAIGPIRDGCDVIGLAQTGTGKTAAFITPIAHTLLTSPPPRAPGKSIAPMTRLRALVLCPTRELAQQVTAEAARIVQGTVLRTACAYGKVGMKAQSQAIARGVDMLIATPGRVRELLDARVLSLAHVRHVAIDEADRMMDMGFLPQVSAILENVAQPRQIVLFTATMPSEIETLASRFLTDPVHIEVDPHTTPAHHVQQHLLEVHELDKVPMLLHLLTHGHNKGVLVFCRTRRRVGWAGTALQRHGMACGMIHGDRSQAQRQRALDRFAKGDLHVVVATDVAARGLHIPAARTVINYDLPIAAEEYVHRVGRAGHGGSFGESFTFLTPQDREAWKRLSKIVNIKLTPEQLDGFTPSVSLGVKRAAPAPRKPKRTATAPTDKPTKVASRPARDPNRPKRSKASRPIKKKDKPGGGVRKPGD